MKNCVILEKRSEGRIEKIQFFDDFFSHYTEENGLTNLRSSTYERANTTKLDCIEAYRLEGFREVQI